MPMIPFYPSLRPRTSTTIFFGYDLPKNEDSEIKKLEKDQKKIMEKIAKTCSDIMPLGYEKTKKTNTDEVNEDSDDGSDSRNEDEYGQFVEDRPHRGSALNLEDSVRTSNESPYSY